MPPSVYEFKTRSVPDVGDQGREDIWGSRLWRRFLRATKTTEIISGGLLHSQGYHTHTRIRRSVVWTRLKMQETTRGHNPAPATGSATSSTPRQARVGACARPSWAGLRRRRRSSCSGLAGRYTVRWPCPASTRKAHAQGGNEGSSIRGRDTRSPI